MRLLYSLSTFLRGLHQPPALREKLQTAHPSDQRIDQLRGLESRLGYQFDDYGLLNRALTHRSFLHDSATPPTDSGGDYEALEFFGDTVVGLVISEELVRSHPHMREGELSKLKAHLVSSRQLSKLARELELGDFLQLSYGEEKTGGRSKRAILADIFESLSAAVYLDGGLEAARGFILARFQPLLEKIDSKTLKMRDFKSTLQEGLHSLGKPEPAYRVVEETGPDHRKHFLVEVISDGRALAQGEGLSKKEAEQEAARLALRALEQLG